MPHPLISVMIPTYNREKYIEEAINSIISQDYSPLEIVVVDDGSTDNTETIIRQYDKNIVHYYKQKRGGQQVARNHCVAQSKGEFLAFLDSDDYYLPGKLTAQMQYLKEHPECEIVFTQVEDFFNSEHDRNAMDASLCEKIRFGGTKVYHATMLARRELLLRVGPFKEHLLMASDQEWLLRMRYVYEVDLSHCLDAVYHRRRLHEGGNAYIVRKQNPAALAEVAKITNGYMRDKIKRDLARARARVTPGQN